MKRDSQGNLVFRSLTEWREHTNYANTTIDTAKSQGQIQRLLIDDYSAEQVIISERQGGQVVVAFRYESRGYVIPVRRAKIAGETRSQIARLQRQAMRVLFWYLKNLLAIRFLTSMGELLMPHMMLETPEGSVRAADAVLAGLPRPALPPGRDDTVEGTFTEMGE